MWNTWKGCHTYYHFFHVWVRTIIKSRRWHLMVMASVLCCTITVKGCDGNTSWVWLPAAGDETYKQILCVSEQEKYVFIKWFAITHVYCKRSRGNSNNNTDSSLQNKKIRNSSHSALQCLEALFLWKLNYIPLTNSSYPLKGPRLLKLVYKKNSLFIKLVRGAGESKN